MSSVRLRLEGIGDEQPNGTASHPIPLSISRPSSPQSASSNSSIVSVKIHSEPSHNSLTASAIQRKSDSINSEAGTRSPFYRQGSSKEKVGSFSTSMAGSSQTNDEDHESPLLSPKFHDHDGTEIVNNMPLIQLAQANASHSSSSSAGPSSPVAAQPPRHTNPISPTAAAFKAHPTHFHSSLPTSLHNPRVMMNQLPRKSPAVRGLDEDDITLIDASGDNERKTASSSPPAAISPDAPKIAITNQPIANPPAHAHFTAHEYIWREIDYVGEHHALLADFVQGIVTHSAPYYNKQKKLEADAAAAAAAAATKQQQELAAAAAASSSSSSSLAQSSSLSDSSSSTPKRPSSIVLPPLPSISAASPRNANSSPTSTSTSGIASVLGNTISSTLSSIGSFFAGEPALTPLTVSAPIYSTDFHPHQLESLTLVATKEQLRKTKIIDGPRYGANNPTEKLLAQLLLLNATSNSAAEEKSSAASAANRSSWSASNSKYPSFTNPLPFFQSPSSNANQSSGINYLPQFTKLDVRMGITGVQLAEGLKKNQTLTTLGLSHNVISEAGCTAICKNLSAHPSLKHLDLSQNILYPVSAPAIRDLLLYNRSLNRLDLSINKLGAEGVATIVEALGSAKPNRSTFVNMVEKASGNTFGVAISNVSGSQSNLNAALNASPSPSGSAASNPSERRATSPMNSPSPSPSPVSLSLAASASAAGAQLSSSPPSSSPMQNAALLSGGSSSVATSPAASAIGMTSPPTSPAPAFIAAFSINQSLTSLSLANNRIGSELDALCAALICSNSALRDLSLQLNDIGDTGCNYLAIALRHPNAALRCLNLADNVIGPFGCKVLMQALEYNTSLTQLDLSWNSIGSSGLGEGPKAIGRLLAVSGTLQQLILHSNSINDAGMRSICAGWNEKVVKGTSALQLLDVSVNPIGDAGVKEICAILSHPNCKLQTLHVNRCNITDDGCGSLVSCINPAISPSPSLRRLSLQGNHSLRIEGVALLIDAYARSHTLLDLDVEDCPHLSRDEVLASNYRKAKGVTFSRLISGPTELPDDLAMLVAEFSMDLRKKTHFIGHNVPSRTADDA